MCKPKPASSICLEMVQRRNSALFELQVRLKKEVLDESMRSNAKQKALVGANSLTGDQWYVQQASRSAHASVLCCGPAQLWLTLLPQLYMMLDRQHWASHAMLAPETAD